MKDANSNGVNGVELSKKIGLLEYIDYEGASLNSRIEKEFGKYTWKNLSEAFSNGIPRLTERLGGAEISVSVVDLKNEKPTIHYNADSLRWAASIIKVPVMIAAYRKIDKKELSLDDELVVDHTHTLERTDSVSRMEHGTILSIRELLDFMICKSDNEATNMLADRIGITYINRTMQEIGATRTMLGHLLAPNVRRYKSVFNPEGSNVTTSRDCAEMLKAIYTGFAASPNSTDLMIQTLEKTHSPHLKSLLPVATKIGCKIGFIHDPVAGSDVHEIGVVNSDYAICVLVSKINQRSALSSPSLKDALDSLIFGEEDLFESLIDPASPPGLGKVPSHIVSKGDGLEQYHRDLLALHTAIRAHLQRCSPQSDFSIEIRRNDNSISASPGRLIDTISYMVHDKYYDTSHVR